jgi:hypothetical protein
MYHAWGDARYWLNVILVPIVCVLPRYLAKVCRQWYFPTALHIARAKQLTQEGGFRLVGAAGQLGTSVATPRTVEHRNGRGRQWQEDQELGDLAAVPPNGVP